MSARDPVKRNKPGPARAEYGEIVRMAQSVDSTGGGDLYATMRSGTRDHWHLIDKKTHLYELRSSTPVDAAPSVSGTPSLLEADGAVPLHPADDPVESVGGFE